MQTDFTFNNPEIKKFFEGDDSYFPERELMYLHTHPLVRPNFVMEIENLVARAGDRLITKKVPKDSKWIVELETLCIRIGATIPDPSVGISDPKETLLCLRELRRLCNEVLKN